MDYTLPRSGPGHSVVAQTLLGAMLRVPYRGAAGQVAFELLAQCRNFLARLVDPVICHDLGGTPILLPFSHNLPIYRVRFPAYGLNITRVAECVAAKYSDLTVVDVGANVGDTAALLRSVTQAPLLCVEGDARFFSLLLINAARLGPNLYLERAFVGGDSGELRAELHANGGTARLVRGGESAEAIHTRSLSDTLQARPTFARSKLIKVDTDGFDTRIVRGAPDLLAKLRPVLFFEYDPHYFAPHDPDGFRVFDSLRDAGYVRAVIYENTGDYLLTADLSNASLLEDLHRFYSGRMGKRYADVCAFHMDDSDVCEAVRRAELEFAGRRGE